MAFDEAGKPKTHKNEENQSKEAVAVGIVFLPARVRPESTPCLT
jgi:hypothetical protein